MGSPYASAVAITLAMIAYVAGEQSSRQRRKYATTLLEQGEHPLVVSTNLGHSDIQVTLNTYSHVTPALQRRAAEATDDVLGKELIESRELVAIP